MDPWSFESYEALLHSAYLTAAALGEMSATSMPASNWGLESAVASGSRSSTCADEPRASSSSGENRQVEVEVKEEVQDEKWSEWYSGDGPVQHDGGSSGDAPTQDASTSFNKVKKRGGKRLDEYNALYGRKFQQKAKGKGKGVGKGKPADARIVPSGSMPKSGGYR